MFKAAKRHHGTLAVALTAKVQRELLNTNVGSTFEKLKMTFSLNFISTHYFLPVFYKKNPLKHIEIYGCEVSKCEERR